MPIQGCTSGWAVTAVITTLLLLPAQYYVPNYHVIAPEHVAPLTSPDAPVPDIFKSLLSLDVDIPGVDLYLTLFFVLAAVIIYLCDWIQRKLMERRIIKLNEYLTDRIEKLRIWDARQEKQENALRLVQNATSEYNILLYLLLRQHKLDPEWQGYDKDPEDFDVSPGEMQDFF